jgi:phosphoribosylaminoimidazole-succinocarboxamide synthase
MALQVNDALRPWLLEKKLRLIDFKLEFGRNEEGNIVLADEISPDTCRFWDSETGEKLDKDRFRRDMGGEKEAYVEVWNRVGDFRFAIPG